MYNIDEIMAMLDWNNKAEVQNKGLKLAQGVKSINVFLQPLHLGCNKNVWENCAKLLSEKPDSTLNPYLMRLLEWIEDLNWPGALIILDRLKRYTDMTLFSFSLNETVKMAEATNNQMWLNNLSKLLSNEKLASAISQNTLRILKEYPNDQWA